MERLSLADAHGSTVSSITSFLDTAGSKRKSSRVQSILHHDFPSRTEIKKSLTPSAIPQKDCLLQGSSKEKVARLKKDFRKYLDLMASSSEWHQDLIYLMELKRCIIDVEKPRDFVTEAEEVFDLVYERANHPVRQLSEMALDMLVFLSQMRMVTRHRKLIPMLLERCGSIKDTMRKKAELSLQVAIREGPLTEVFQILMNATNSKLVNVRRYASSYILEMIETDQSVPITDNLRKVILRDVTSTDKVLRYCAIRLKFLIERLDEERYGGGCIKENRTHFKLSSTREYAASEDTEEQQQ